MQQTTLNAGHINSIDSAEEHDEGSTQDSTEKLTGEQLRRSWLEFSCCNSGHHCNSASKQMVTLNMSANNIDHHHCDNHHHHQDKEEDANNEARKNLDSGYAWCILLIMFLLQASVGGSSRVYGVVFAQEVALGYYDREQASWPIATASTVENLASLLAPALANYLSWRQMELLGTLLFIGANLLAYASDSLWLDIVALGVVQGLALATTSVLSLAINNDYFERFRTTAFGIAMSGSAFGVLYLSPLVSWLLDTYAGRFRLVYLALACVFCTNTVLVLFIKPRSKSHSRGPKGEAHVEPGAKSELANHFQRKHQDASHDERVASRKISLFEEHFERKSSLASISYQTRSRRQSAWRAQPCVQTSVLGGGGGSGREFDARLNKSHSGLELAARRKASGTLGARKMTHQLALDQQLADGGKLAAGLHAPLAPTRSNSSDFLELKIDQTLVESDPKAPKWRYESAEDTTLHQQQQQQQQQQLERIDQGRCQEQAQQEMHDFTLAYACKLLRTPYLHCTWIMLALYYLIARIFVIILVDFADDHGFSLKQSSSLLNYWAFGELVGRLFLGSLIDLRFLSCRSCIVLTCSLLSAAIVTMVMVESYFVYATCSVLVAALISLEYMLINVLMVEYVGKQSVTSCYSLAAFISSAVLFARPLMIGLFRDKLGSYDGLLLLLAGLALAFALLFGALEPLLVRRWPRPTPKATSEGCKAKKGPTMAK